MDHMVENLFKALRGGKVYLRPRNFRVTHRLDDVNGLMFLRRQYDLFLLDRDCTLQEYHGKERVRKFETTLQMIRDMSEIISNSSFETFMRIREIYRDFPVNKLVTFLGSGDLSLLRVEDGKLSVFNYNLEQHTFADETSTFVGPNESLAFPIDYSYDKPNPAVIDAVVRFNIERGKIPIDPKALMVGDAYLTDIVAGNRAGIDTARVKPYEPGSNPFGLRLVRRVDSLFGAVMSNDRRWDW